MREEPRAAVALDAPYIRVRGAVGADCAVDYLELQVRVTLKQAHLEIYRLGSIEEKHSVPLDIEDAVGRTALDRCEDTAPICPSGAAGVGCKGHQILPQPEDGEVIGPDVRRRGQTGRDVAARLILDHKIKAPVGVNAYRVVSLIVQREWEW